MPLPVNPGFDEFDALGDFLWCPVDFVKQGSHSLADTKGLIIVDLRFFGKGACPVIFQPGLPPLFQHRDNRQPDDRGHRPDTAEDGLVFCHAGFPLSLSARKS